MNIQNIPRSDKTIKTAFVPKLDAFMFCDYPSIELKILAWYLDSMGWASMAEKFRAGADLHRASAAGIFGIPEDAVTDEQRQVGKVLNFSVCYGGGTRTLIRQGVARDYPEAMTILRAFHSTWPGIGWETKRQPAVPGTLIHAIKHRMAQRGYITTLYGRRLHPLEMHAALNRLCQGCAADLMKWAMVRVYDGLRESGYKSHMVNTVHDEIMLDCADAEVTDNLHEDVPNWMTDPMLEDVVPIKPGVEVSRTTWADKEPLTNESAERLNFV